MEKQQNLRPVEELPNITDLILNKQETQIDINNISYIIDNFSKSNNSNNPMVNLKLMQEPINEQNITKSIAYEDLKIQIHLGDAQIKMPNSYSLESEAKDKQLVNIISKPLSEQNDKIDLKIDLKAERTSEYNDSVDKTIKIPDKYEIANNPNFEMEKGIDKNGVQMADDKSINTIAQDYIKGQEREIERKMFNMPESAKGKSEEMER